MAPGVVVVGGGGIMRVGRSEGKARTCTADAAVPKRSNGECTDKCMAVIVESLQPASDKTISAIQ